jgi:hypothetical protein
MHPAKAMLSGRSGITKRDSVELSKKQAFLNLSASATTGYP